MLHRAAWISLAVVLLSALACGPSGDDEPRVGMVAAAASGSPTGSSSATATPAGFDCDAQPAGWPATKAEIIDGLGANTYAKRQCASARLASRICSSVPAALKTDLQDLAANSPDAEIRDRANSLLSRYSDPPTADVALITDGTRNEPRIIVQGDATHFKTCELRVTESVGGSPAEDTLFTTFGPSANVDLCGRGSIDEETWFTCVPGRSYSAVLTCASGDGRSASDSDSATCPQPPATPNATP